MSNIQNPIDSDLGDQTSVRTPEISIIIACYNGARFLADAASSALAQKNIVLEVLIIDDHSTDESHELANKLANKDSRIKVLQTPKNAGPGGARNVGIDAMRGRWYAMLDCDDTFAPDRCRALIDAAEKAGADMIADDLAVFGDDIEPHRHLGEAQPPSTITLEGYFAGTIMYSPRPNLGFLKPIIRASTLDQRRYRTDLRIGEDDELVIQLLLSGANYAYHSQALYNYRKHEASISHRLSADHSALMVKSEENIRAQVMAAGRNSDDYKKRYSAILDAAAFADSVEALKEKQLSRAISAIAARPSALRHYAMPIAAHWKRFAQKS
ncbi:MAG: glycosyltransferase family 2 protein [Pseudomonadota bacterium]